MKPFLSKLWNDSDYFHKMLTLLIATAAVTLPTLPLGDLGSVGYWIGKYGVPIAIALGATGKSSGLTADEAAKLRALIPTQAILDARAPQV